MKKLIWLALLLPLPAIGNPFTDDFCLEKADDDICIGFNSDRLRLDALEAALASQSGAMEVTVDCGIGETITGVLNANSETVVPLIITVQGECADNINLDRDKVVIQGDPNDGPDTIRAANNSTTILSVLGANEIYVSDLTITGDAVPSGSVGVGVLCRANAHVTITNVTVSHRSTGIFAGIPKNT